MRPIEGLLITDNDEVGFFIENLNYLKLFVYFLVIKFNG